MARDPRKTDRDRGPQRPEHRGGRASIWALALGILLLAGVITWVANDTALRPGTTLGAGTMQIDDPGGEAPANGGMAPVDQAETDPATADDESVANAEP